MNAAAILMALFNGAWQGTLLGLAALALLRHFRGLNAATRYAIWSGLLVLTLLLPVANYAFSVRPVTQVAQGVYVQIQPLRPLRIQATAALPARSVYKRVSFAAPAQPTLYQRVIHEAAQLDTYAWTLLAIALLIVLARVALIGNEVVKMFAARRRVRRIRAPFALHDSVRRAYGFAASSDFGTPCVLGFRPALIVIPDALFEADERELLSVVLHEHEHVMRFDDVQNVVHRTAGAIGFFLPGVRIALHELAVYREQICDDAAIAGSGNRYAYARALSAMAGWIQKAPAPVPCFIFKRKQLLRRIEVLLDSAVSHSLRPNGRFAVSTVAACMLIAALVLRFQVPVFAERAAETARAKPAVAKIAPRARVEPAIVPRAMVRIPHAIAKPIAAKPKLAKTVKLNVTVVRSKVATFAPIAEPIDAVVVPASLPLHLHVHARVVGLAPRAYAEAFAVAQAYSVAPPPRVAGGNAWLIVRAPRAPRQSGDLLDALAKMGYTNLSVDDLIALRNHGVTGSLIETATQVFGRLSVADLTMLADHGVSCDYLTELRAAGIRTPTPADAVRLRDHGVSLTLLPYFGRLNTSDLLTLADNGVSGSYLSELRAAGLANLNTADVVRLRDHGVSLGLIASLRALGYGLNVDDLTKLADHGVSGLYVQSIQRLRSVKRLTIDDIIRLHDGGFTP